MGERDDVVVRFSDVSFSYQGTDGVSPALDHVSFEVARGEAVALLGPNGCGKSTALRLLVGLDVAQGGVVEAVGQRVDAEAMADVVIAKRLRQRVGLVFQNPDVQLFCPSVGEEIAFGPRQMGLSDAEVAERVGDMERLLGISDLHERAPYHLSGGERHKVAIAAVASMSPEVLLIDEPTSGLDEEGEGQVVSFLRTFLASGRTVLVTTHHPCLPEQIGAREVRLDRYHRMA
jgi:cobalt/nickel transport system ATP-binding protein